MCEMCCAGKMFMEAGLEPDMKVMASSSKTLSFRKPEAGSGPPSLNGTSARESSTPASTDGTPATKSFDEIVAAEKSAAEMGIVPAS